MKPILPAVLFTLAGSMQPASAQPVQWTTYINPETQTSVDVPSSVFTKRAGPPAQGSGQRFQRADGQADLTVEDVANTSNESPAAFLAKRNPPPRIQYKRVTSRFFAVSSYRGDKVWYDRCNFSARLIHCVLINYPAREERAWDGIVTRISLSLRGG